MKRFFNLLLIGIAVLGLSGLNAAYAEIGGDVKQIDPTDKLIQLNDPTKIEKIMDFVQEHGHDVFEEEKTGREITIGLGWEQDHPEWTSRVAYHFLVKVVTVYKVAEETKIIFHQLWLSPSDLASFADNPQFQGLKETDLFFKAISIYSVNDNLRGEIVWVFYYRDDLQESDSLSAAEAKDEFSKEVNWWNQFIDNADKNK